MAGGAYDAGSSRISADYNPLTSILTNLEQDANLILEMAEQFIKNIEQIIEESIVQIIKTLTGFDITNLVDEFGNFLSIDGFESFLNGLIGTFGGAGSGVGGVLSTLEQFVSSFEGINILDPGSIIIAIENAIFSLISEIPGVSTIENFIGLFGTSGLSIPAQIEAALGDIPAFVEQVVQGLIDTLFNGLTGSNASGIGLGLIGQEIRNLVTAVSTVGDLATQAFSVTQTFGGLLHQLFEELPVIPFYQGFADFLGQIGNILSGLIGSVFTSLSPSNPPVAQANNQIAALWAHVQETNTAGIHYDFNSTVALTANYPGTSNPSWSAAGPLALPTVPSGANYVQCAVSAGPQGMVFTGNPNGVVTGDHGLVTDRNQVYVTLERVVFGKAIIYMAGHYVSGNLGQNLALQLGYGGPAAAQLYTCTGPASGMTAVGPQYDLTATPKVGDVIGIQGDGATPETYTMYYNNMPVGTPWTDTGGVLTRGAGYRETGIIEFNDGFNNPLIGLGGFVALDYV